MTMLTEIKKDFQADHADQIVAIRSDVARLHLDLIALRDDLLDNEAAVKRRRKRPGSDLWAHSYMVDDSGRQSASTVTQKMQQHPLASAAIASAVICAVSAFAIWSSRNTQSA